MTVVAPSTRGQDVAAEPTQPVTQIEAAVAAYVEALNQGDLKGLTDLWTPEGVYIARSGGQRVNGRDAIAEQFSDAVDKESAAKLAVETQAIEFISPGVALERGEAWVTRGDLDVTHSQYSAIYVKRGDRWLIDRITEDELVQEPSHFEQLQALEWMIGQWVDVGEGFTITMDCKWTEKQNYISRTYSVIGDDGFTSSGLQLIGWDAKEEAIRSWLFDSEGGFVLGRWSQRDDEWVVQSVATLADGSSGSFTSIYRPQEDGSYRWQKIHRVVDGTLLPNLDEITVKKK